MFAILLLVWVGTLTGCGENLEHPPDVAEQSTVTDTEAYPEATRGVEEVRQNTKTKELVHPEGSFDS